MEKKEDKGCPKKTEQAGAELCQAQSSAKPGNPLPCPLFFRTHCPNINRGCKFHHNTQICLQGDACGTKTCALRHPPNCQLFLLGWCGFIIKQGIPKRYKQCSYFHPPDVKQVPPSPSSVMLITATSDTTTPPATGKKTPPEKILQRTHRRSQKKRTSWG